MVKILIKFTWGKNKVMNDLVKKIRIDYNIKLSAECECNISTIYSCLYSSNVKFLTESVSSKH